MASGETIGFWGVRKVVCNPGVCSGCRACEAVCSLYHEGVVSPELSRIQIMTWEYEAWRCEIYVCDQCLTPKCAAACPLGAIHVDGRSGALVVDEESCNGCMLCLGACPCAPPRIRYHAGKNICIKCDLCGGDPRCVKFCYEGALALEER